jgi:hypothetical protein
MQSSSSYRKPGAAQCTGATFRQLNLTGQITVKFATIVAELAWERVLFGHFHCNRTVT